MRKIQELKDNWCFSKIQKELPTAIPSGEGWEKISLPHSWNAVDGHDGSSYDRGAFWYVTAFTAPQYPLPGARTYVEVGAAALVGEVYVNGMFLTRHMGGFSAFRHCGTDSLGCAGKLEI